MKDNSRISIDPEILFGKPRIKGTRISVEQVLSCLEQGLSIDKIVDEFPPLNTEDVYAAIHYSREVIQKSFMVNVEFDSKKNTHDEKSYVHN